MGFNNFFDIVYSETSHISVFNNSTVRLNLKVNYQGDFKISLVRVIRKTEVYNVLVFHLVKKKGEKICTAASYFRENDIALLFRFDRALLFLFLGCKHSNFTCPCLHFYK